MFHKKLTISIFVKINLKYTNKTKFHTLLYKINNLPKKLSEVVCIFILFVFNRFSIHLMPSGQDKSLVISRSFYLSLLD